MPFYTQGPEQFSNTQAAGIENLQSSFGQSVGAAFGQGIDAMPTSELSDMARHWGEASQGIPLSADDANAQFGIPGTLHFDAPVSSAVASDLNQSKRQQILRQTAIDSGPQGILSSIARGAAGAIPQFMDPINIGSAFVPGLGDARMAAALSEASAATARAGLGRAAGAFAAGAERTTAIGETLEATRAGRALQGASQGALGQAALEPLNYAFDRDEHNDWSMGQALGDIAFGGLLGGGLHMLIPRARLDAEAEPTVQSLTQPADAEQMANPMAARMEAAGPDARGQTLNDALAAVNEDRPNNAESLLQLNEAQNLRDELATWAQQNERVQADQDAFLNSAARDDAAQQARRARDGVRTSDEITALQRQIEDLHAQHAGVAQEEQALRDQWSRMFGDTTGDRLEAVRTELESPALPAARRAALEAEERMLTEGGGSADQRAIEQQRTQAQITGLDRQGARLQAQIRRAEQMIERRRGRASPEGGPDVTTLPAFRAAASRIQSRQDVLHALTHRSLARYARRVGSGIDDAGLRGLAARVLSADNPDEAIGSVISDIGRARGNGGVYPDLVNQSYVDALRNMDEMRGNATDSILRNVQRGDTPEVASARQASEMQTIDAPDASAVTVPEELAQAKKALADVDAALAQITDDAAREELDAIQADRERAEGTAKAYEAAAACMARTIR